MSYVFNLSIKIRRRERRKGRESQQGLTMFTVLVVVGGEIKGVICLFASPVINDISYIF